MVWVNLLPWRERWLRQQRFRWLRSLILPPLCLLLCIAAGYGQGKLNALRARQNALWQQAGAQLQQAITQRTALQKRLDAQQPLLAQLRWRHQQGLRWQQLLPLLAQQLPDALWLAQLQGDDRRITLRGFCSQVEEVHQLRAVLQRAGLFRQANIGRLQRQQNGRLAFTVTAQWLIQADDD